MKNLISLIFLFLLFCFSNITYAQLNGTYTLGPSPSDSFASFIEAVDSLKNQGVNGPVIISIASGIYTEQIRITEINGASNTNTITFQSETGNPNNVSLRYSSSSSTLNYIIHLDSADHIHFKDLTIEATNFTYAKVIEISGGANNNSFTGNKIIGVPTSITSDEYTLIFSLNDLDTSNSFDSNTLLYGSWGIYLSGSSLTETNTKIRYNQFIDQYRAGIALSMQNSPLVSNNIITSNSSNAQFRGILLESCINNSRVLRNRISFSSDGLGILYMGSNGSTGNEALIANNFVQIGGNTIAIGIYINDSQKLNVYNNNVNITSTTLTSAGRAVDIESSSATASNSLDFKNNILANKGSGYGFTTFSTDRITCDYNNYHTSGAIGYWNGIFGGTLAIWQAATNQDSNSFTFNPGFISETDLHITSASLDSTGIPISVITDDIDGDIRNVNYPDIGADEFDIFQTDAGITSLVEPQVSYPGIPSNVSVLLKNFGVDTLTTVIINWEVNGVLQTPDTFVGSLLTNLETIISLGTYIFNSGTSYTLKAWTSGPNNLIDGNNQNDTLYSAPIKTGLSGTHTIGLPPADFSTFNDALNSIKIYGIYAPVIFNIDSGSYNEQLNIPEVPGASPINTITFQSASGNPDEVILSISSTTWYSNYTLKFSGADYFIFKNITISSTGGTRIIEIQDNSIGNKFIGNKLIGMSTNTTSSNYSIIYSGTDIDSANVFDSNTFENGSYGIYFSGGGLNSLENSTLISNNIFINQFRAAIFLYFQNSVNILSNIINTNTTYTSFIGINTNYCHNNLRILRNKVTMDIGGTGIHVSQSNGSTNYQGIIANNFVHIGGNNTNATGISNTYSSFQNFFHNSVNITNNVQNGRAFYLANSNNVTSKNNIFANHGMGYSLWMDGSGIVSDYNNYFNTGTYLGYRSGMITDLNNWISTTNLDSNSQSVDPIFNSNTDLHCISLYLDSAGTSITVVTHDIDGDVRNSVMPDIGADEYIIPDLDAGITAFISPELINCSGNTAVEVQLTNLGKTVLDSVIIHWYVNDTIQTPFYWTGNLSYLADTLLIIGVYNLVLDTNYTISVKTSQPNGLQDERTSNDSITLSNISIIPFPSFNSINNDSICKGETAFLKAIGTTDVYQWWDSLDGGTLLSEDSVITTDTLYNSKTYYVTVGTIGRPDSISTSNDNINSEMGNMFDVIASTDLTLDSFQVHTSSTLNFLVKMYFKQGSYIGYESADTVWTYLDTHIVINNISGKFCTVPIGGLKMYAGDTLGIYITSADILTTLYFTDGANLFSDQNLIISTGTKCFYPFDLNFEAGKTWNGKIFYSVGSICTTPRMPVEAFVKPIPDVDLGNDTSICKGTNISLNAGQGIDFDYSWKNLPSPLIISKNQTLSIDSVGNYYVFIADGCGNNDRDTISISINPKPNADAGTDQNICLGDSVTLSASGGTSYIWNGLDSSQTISIAPKDTGFYTVIVYDNFGCSDTDSVEVIVNSLPLADAGTDKLVCYGDTVMLTASGGISYLWNTTATSQSILIYATDTQQYIATVFNLAGCMNSDTVNVVVKPLPEPDLGKDTTICAQNIIQLDAGAGMDQYLWYDNSIGQQLILDSSGIGLNTKTIGVTVTLNGCSQSDSIKITFEICESTGDLLNQLSIKSYPNPSNGPIKIHIDNFRINEIMTCEITLIDSKGNTIYREELYVNSKKYIKEINFSSIPKGIYLLTIHSTTKLKSSKTLIYGEKIVLQ